MQCSVLGSLLCRRQSGTAQLHTIDYTRHSAGSCKNCQELTAGARKEGNCPGPPHRCCCWRGAAILRTRPPPPPGRASAAQTPAHWQKMWDNAYYYDHHDDRPPASLLWSFALNWIAVDTNTNVVSELLHQQLNLPKSWDRQQEARMYIWYRRTGIAMNFLLHLLTSFDSQGGQQTTALIISPHLVVCVRHGSVSLCDQVAFSIFKL